MEIGLIYSRTDPRQQEARNFVQRWIMERGILADIVESEQPVQSPTLVINGHTIQDRRTAPRVQNAPMFPDLRTIEHALERHCWSL